MKKKIGMELFQNKCSLTKFIFVKIDPIFVCLVLFDTYTIFTLNSLQPVLPQCQQRASQAADLKKRLNLIYLKRNLIDHTHAPSFRWVPNERLFHCHHPKPCPDFPELLLIVEALELCTDSSCWGNATPRRTEGHIRQKCKETSNLI